MLDVVLGVTIYGQTILTFDRVLNVVKQLLIILLREIETRNSKTEFIKLKEREFNNHIHGKHTCPTFTYQVGDREGGGRGGMGDRKEERRR